MREAPRRLGRYEIVEPLSFGGMGEVFLARYRGPGGFVKAVALKRILPMYATESSFIDMLLDEARLASVVRHPNIVATLDVGCDEGQYYLVTDFVCGENLSKIERELRKSERDLPLWLAAWVGARIASALHAAHEARSLDGERLDIVHRDVSLSNIILADDGAPMLFDFGVAKARQRLQQTREGQIKGKISYMDPALFDGESVDRSVDIFSLGVVLYEMVTQTSPYLRDNEFQTLAALQSGNVKPPSALRSGVDAELDDIIMCAMARRRSARTASASEVERRLRLWAHERDLPHDAEAAAGWVLGEMPSGVDQRKARLLRVASHAAQSDPPPPSRASHAAPAPEAPPTRVDGPIARPAPPPVEPQPAPPPEPETLAPVGATGAPLAPSPAARRRQVGVALSVALVPLLLFAASRGASSPAPSGLVAQNTSPSASASAPALPAVSVVEDPSPAPSASAKASAKKNPPARPPPPTKVSAAPGDRKGPLVRSYDP